MSATKVFAWPPGAGRNLLLFSWALPFGMLGLQAGTRLFLPAQYKRFFEGEHGLVELATVLAMLGAAAAFGWCSWAIRGLWKRAVIVATAMSMGCVFLAGEELSRGQHLFGWEPTDYFRTHNRQAESNLHNLLDIRIERLGKAVVLTGVLVAGLVLPIPTLRSRYGVGRTGLLWPSPLCFGSAIVLLVVRVAERLATWLQMNHLPLLDMRLKETMEMLMGMVLFTWALGAVAAVRKEQNAALDGLAQP